MDINLKFHHVSIRTAVFDATIKFYEALGLSKYIEWTEKEGRCAFLEKEDSFLLEVKEFKEEVFEPGRFQHLCFHVDDVDAFHQMAVENGAKEIGKPHDSPLPCLPKPIPNYRSSYVIGPGGEGIEIINWYGFCPR